MTVPIITNLINRSFSRNTFPNAWKMAEVIPIQKSGDYEDPANTRPASLLPIVSKAYERSALSQFRDFLDSNGIILTKWEQKTPFHGNGFTPLY